MSRPSEAREPPGAPERLWELSSDLMAVTDMTGRLLAVNSAWETLLGWTEAELLASSTVELLHPDDVELVTAQMMSVILGAAPMKFESRLRARDGEYRLFSWRAAADQGHMYVVGRDVTELRRQEEVLRHAHKMEAVGQLTGGVAHDFNNLLTIIRSAVDFLKKPDLPEARRQRYVEAIEEAVGRATKVTQQLLAFARRQKLAPEVFDAAERIADVSELLRELVGQRIRIITDAPAGECWVEADLTQFETALMNLASNARDAMAGEGTLVIEARPVKQIPAVRNHAPTRGEFIAVSVRDTGAGIDPADLPRIFEPFYSTKDTGKGAGLGLSQVYGFAKQSGGSVDVRSTPGAGAVFTLYLPRSAHAAISAPPAEQAPDPPAQETGALRVLVVEDNEEVGKLCLSILQDLGYRPDLARNADEALAALARDEGGFDLVFSDIVMPGMSGIELAERIREARPDLPVLLTSGYSPVLAQEGSHGFPLVAKPYSARGLDEAIAALMQRRATAPLVRS